MTYLPEIDLSNTEKPDDFLEAEQKRLCDIISYCVNSIKKREQACYTCLAEIELRESFFAATLTELKENTQGSLVSVSKKVSSSIKVEKMFRTFYKKGFIKKFKKLSAQEG